MANVRALLNLEGCVSVVTGGATGIGFQMATGLAEAGSNIVLCSRKVEVCEAACAELEKLGVQTLAVACDVTKLDQVEAIHQASLKLLAEVGFEVLHQESREILRRSDAVGARSRRMAMFMAVLLRVMRLAPASMLIHSPPDRDCASPAPLCVRLRSLAVVDRGQNRPSLNSENRIAMAWCVDNSSNKSFSYKIRRGVSSKRGVRTYVREPFAVISVQGREWRVASMSPGRR